MSFKLDLKDKKILYELDKDARQSFSLLAKKVGLSKQVVGYRVKNLVDSKVINKFYTIINIAKLGYTVRKAFIKFQNTSEKTEQNFINYLVNQNSVVWVASADGAFDLAFGLWSKNIREYDMLLAEIDGKFGKYMAQRQIAPIVEGQYFYRDYLLGKEAGTERTYLFGSVPEKVELDKTDWDILPFLGHDARSSAAQISRDIGISEDVVGKRIRTFERNGIVQNYILVLNNSTIGQLHYKVLVGLRNLTQEKYKQLVQFCKLHPNIVYIVKTFGVWEFEIDIEVKDAIQFRSIMREIKHNFSDIISDYNVLSIYQIHKYNFCPFPMKSTVNGRQS